MAYICEICSKGVSVGRSQKHGRGVAGKRWKDRAQATPRLFKPNLQKVTLDVSGKRIEARICTKCIKRIKKYGSVREYKKIAVL